MNMWNFNLLTSDEKRLFQAVYNGNVEQIREIFVPQKGTFFGFKAVKINLQTRTDLLGPIN